MDNYFTLASNYGKQMEHWNGIDVTVNARLPQGIRLQGGMSTGRTSTDNCEVLAAAAGDRSARPAVLPRDTGCS